jgi:hypothetical protein
MKKKQFSFVSFGLLHVRDHGHIRGHRWDNQWFLRGTLGGLLSLQISFSNTDLILVKAMSSQTIPAIVEGKPKELRPGQNHCNDALH